MTHPKDSQSVFCWHIKKRRFRSCPSILFNNSSLQLQFTETMTKEGKAPIYYTKFMPNTEDKVGGRVFLFSSSAIPFLNLFSISVGTCDPEKQRGGQFGGCQTSELPQSLWSVFVCSDSLLRVDIPRRGVSIDGDHNCIGYRPIVDGVAQDFTFFTYVSPVCCYGP